MTKSVQAHIALFVVTALWGLTFPLVKDAVHDVSPSAFVMMRLLVAALIFLPFVLARWKQVTGYLLRSALLLGLLQSGNYVCQSIGLQTVSSADSAFITAFSVVLVPFIALVSLRNKPQWSDFVAGFICLLGLFILTGADFSKITIGDAWTAACALFYALYIVALQRISKNIEPENFLMFLGWQMIFSLTLPFATVSYQHLPMILSWPVIAAVLFCAIVATCLVFYLQLRFQRYVSASKAALIYAFEPLFATILAYFVNDEPIYLRTTIGGAIIFISFVFSEYVAYVGEKR